jgi:hypothetical protein
MDQCGNQAQARAAKPKAGMVLCYTMRCSFKPLRAPNNFALPDSQCRTPPLGRHVTTSRWCSPGSVGRKHAPYPTVARDTQKREGTQSV